MTKINETVARLMGFARDAVTMMEGGDGEHSPSALRRLEAALRTELEAVQGEPVAWKYQCTADKSEPILSRQKTNWAENGSGLWIETPLYTTPQPAPLQGEPVVIPDDVREAAKALQNRDYCGPVAWAAKVINFVADYTTPQPVQPSPVITMKPMEGEDGTKGWYVDGPDFYCDVERKPGEQYSVFIRSKDGAEGFSETAQPPIGGEVTDAEVYRAKSLIGFADNEPTRRALQDFANNRAGTAKPVQPAPVVPQVCCDNPSQCLRPCTPRGEWLARQPADDIDGINAAFQTLYGRKIDPISTSDLVFVEGWREAKAAQPVQPIGGEVTDEEIMNRVLAVGVLCENKKTDEAMFLIKEIGLLNDALAAPVAQAEPLSMSMFASVADYKAAQAEPAQSVDAERLDFIVNQPARYVERSTNGMYRVYQDHADKDAEHALWQSMTLNYYPTARQAIDAARGVGGGQK